MEIKYCCGIIFDECSILTSNSSKIDCISTYTHSYLCGFLLFAEQPISVQPMSPCKCSEPLLPCTTFYNSYPSTNWLLPRNARLLWFPLWLVGFVHQLWNIVAYSNGAWQHICNFDKLPIYNEKLWNVCIMHILTAALSNILSSLLIVIELLCYWVKIFHFVQDHID